MQSMLDLFFPQLSLRVSNLERKVSNMSAALDALKAAIAADADADAKLVAYLVDLKGKMDALSAQLATIQAQDVIAPADVQAIADQLAAHAADVATHLPVQPAV